MEAMLAGAGRGYAGYRAGTGGGEETEVSEIGFLDLLRQECQRHWGYRRWIRIVKLHILGFSFICDLPPFDCLISAWHCNNGH